jgi:arsenite-transporting ATPase
VLECRLGPDPQPVVPDLDALEVDACGEMSRHWGRVRDYLVALFRYQGIEELVADELALLPGAEELASLLAVERHVRDGRWRLVVVDCAPTDSALRLLTLPDATGGVLRLALRVERMLASLVTPLARAVVPVPLPGSEVFRDAERLLYGRLRQIRALLGAPGTSVRLVVTPEQMVIDEARRAHTDLSLFEVRTDAVVMNRLLPEVAAEEPHFRDWVRIQAARCAEVEELFSPLRVLHAPLREDEVTGLAALTAHGSELFGELRPEAILTRAPSLRFRRHDDGYCMTLPLPHARREAIDVAKVDGQLVLRVGSRSRSLALPRHLAGLPLAGASLQAGRLRVRFAASEDV